MTVNLAPKSLADLNAMRHRARLHGGVGQRAMPSALQTSPLAGVSGLSGPLAQFSTDPNSIVTVHVSTVQAPTPNTYQQCGALVSYGSTNLAPQTTAQLTQFSDLDPILQDPASIGSLTWASGLVTLTSAIPLTPAFAPGSQPHMVITGNTPAGYNYVGPVTVVDNGSFTYPVAVNPGPTTVTGAFMTQDATELSQMAWTFFGQGNIVSVWVLELGYQTSVANDAAALATWLSVNDRSFYGYLLPRKCGQDAPSIQTFVPTFQYYQNSDRMTYFWLTVLPSTMATLDATYKDVIQFVEAPSVTDVTKSNIASQQGEFTLAAMFYNALAYRPSNTNPVAPMAFKYLFGVTPYPTQNTGPTLISFKTNNTNYVSTGAEGGIAFNTVYSGVTKDGFDYFNWWWTIDWIAINVNLDLSNAIINGSNNPLAPLYYNQDGINYLESTLYNTMQNASTFGMVLGRLTMTALDGPALISAIHQGTFAGMCDVNAVPFINYSLANPGDYKIGEYDGLSTLFIPARGFIHILVLITASSLVSV